jgi:hypothetical protein
MKRLLMPAMPDWKNIERFILALGWTKGVFALFFFMAHGWIYWLYHGRLKDRQAEIDRIAAENREYRIRFLKVYDKQYTFRPPKPKGGK